MRWPAEFMWGTAASSTQCEGAAPASDWWDWERSGHAPISGQGNGFAARHAEDFALLAALGLTHHRLSIEWARIEPEPGVHDAAAVEHYRAVLTAARDAGITPWVCLHHFTLPRWFAADGGFLDPTGRTGAWTRHVDFMAETFGDLTGGWQPVNETNYYARAAYGGGGWPPGTNDREQVAAVDEAIQLATAEAAVRLRQTGAPVSSIFGLSAIVAAGRPRRDARLRGGDARAAVDARPRPASGRGVAHTPPRPDRATRSRWRVRPDRLLVLLGDGSAERPPRCPSSRCAGIAARLRDLGRRPGARARPPPSGGSRHAASRRRVRHRHGRRRPARRIPPAWDRGHERRSRARSRRARLLPLDRDRQLRVAPRLRRLVRDHRRDRNVRPSAEVLRREAVTS